MRVLHLNAGNLYGGIETLLATLARERGLCPNVEPHFALCFEERHAEELRAARVPVHLLGEARASRPWTVVAARRRLRRVLGGLNPDLVLTHGCWPHALFAPVVRRHGTPLVFWAHGIQGGQHWLERWARRTPPDLVLANSRLTRQSVATTLFPDVESEVLYLPVSPAAEIDRATARKEVRAAIGAADETVVIALAARMEGLKGHGALLEALATLVAISNWQCWIAGGAQRPDEEDYLRRLRTRAGALGIAGRVRFLGHRSDLRRVLAAADIYCQPNTAPEAFGLTFVEALYAGLPVLTTALGGALEILTPDCGRLTPPGDIVALSRTLRELVTDSALRECLGTSGPARAAELCDPQRQLERLSGVCHGVVGHGGVVRSA